MEGWTWLLLIALVIVLVLGWRDSRELHDTRRRASKLARRVKRLRQRIMLDRLDRLERDVRDIEDLIIRRRAPVHGSEDTEGLVARYVATCRSFVHRSLGEGRGPDHADAVVRVVLGRLVRDDPGCYVRLEQILSPAERDRWLKERAVEWRD